MEKDTPNTGLLISFLSEYGIVKKAEWAELIIETLSRLLGTTLQAINEKQKTQDGFSKSDVANALRDSINEIADCFNTAFNKVERENEQ